MALARPFSRTFLPEPGTFPFRSATSAGRDGFGPDLSLQYSSGNGNGPFGLGWQLSVPRVTRKTEKGLPKYSDEDVFVMSGAETLVPFMQLNDDEWALEGLLDRGDYEVRRYRPRIEGMFARIEQWVRKSDRDVHWRATTGDNVTSVYGRTHEARVFAESEHGGGTPRVYEWLLQDSFDAKGNHVLYEYATDAVESLGELYERNRSYRQKYLRRILYCNSKRGRWPGTRRRRSQRSVVYDTASLSS